MVGSDFSLIQGLGGNGSVKYGDAMLIKASGKRLSDASSPNHFYKVGISNGEYRETRSNQAGRPSIEVFLHAMLPQKYVVHLHSSKAVALSMLLPNNPSLQAEVQSQGILVIPYTKPGRELREVIKTKMPAHIDTSSPISILLQNHHLLTYQVHLKLNNQILIETVINLLLWLFAIL
jgi:rhamnose utilization protein RhaD (predicted bifunctional aldolase and dehydrogenase)